MTILLFLLIIKKVTKIRIYFFKLKMYLLNWASLFFCWLFLMFLTVYLHILATLQTLSFVYTYKYPFCSKVCCKRHIYFQVYCVQLLNPNPVTNTKWKRNCRSKFRWLFFSIVLKVSQWQIFTKVKIANMWFQAFSNYHLSPSSKTKIQLLLQK